MHEKKQANRVETRLSRWNSNLTKHARARVFSPDIKRNQPPRRENGTHCPAGGCEGGKKNAPGNGPFELGTSIERTASFKFDGHFCAEVFTWLRCYDGKHL